ncbi:MAG: YihY/virulence factor BrkB family protein [Verrucomicrobia bacterium]|nr:YihY/virulence factor BrkB family protein [Verrucomicrobiota bacterium]
MFIRSLPGILKKTAQEWMSDNALRLSASLAYYALFSLAPLLLVVISIAGLVFGQDAARHQLAQTVQQLAGEQAGRAIEGMAQTGEHQGANLVATVFGLVVLLFGASGVFGELKSSLNTIWGVTEKPGQSILHLLKERLVSLGMVVGIGFLLLISLVLTALLTALSTYMRGLLPWPPGILHLLDFLISLCVVAVLFAMIFKVLPNVKLRWHDVWIGALGTAVLFVLGQSLIGLYLGKSSVSSSYGAAGSVIIILLWIYYSNCILFFGVEFTKIYALRCGFGIEPTEDAITLEEANKAKQKDNGDKPSRP